MRVCGEVVPIQQLQDPHFNNPFSIQCIRIKILMCMICLPQFALFVMHEPHFYAIDNFLLQNTYASLVRKIGTL